MRPMGSHARHKCVNRRAANLSGLSCRSEVAVEMSQVSPFDVMYPQGEHDIILV
jgi:hypothetical protein